MKPGHSKFTAFITPFGCYEPTVMFFGLCNSPATFQRMMNDLFGPLLHTGCILIYMDDILIFSQDLASHVKIIKEVLQVLKDNHLSLKPSKCAFHKESVEYLGQVISHGTVTIRPAHTSTISKWPVPKDKTGIQRIIRLSNYFRKFIPNYSTLISPLSALTGNSPFEWTDNCAKALEELKAILSSQPVLKLPNTQDPF